MTQDKEEEEKREKQRQLADFHRKQAAEQTLIKGQPSSFLEKHAACKFIAWSIFVFIFPDVS